MPVKSYSGGPKDVVRYSYPYPHLGVIMPIKETLEFTDTCSASTLREQTFNSTNGIFGLILNRDMSRNASSGENGGFDEILLQILANLAKFVNYCKF